MSLFMVFSFQRGIVRGDIVLKLMSGLELNCFEGIQVPNDVTKIQDIRLLDSNPRICYILC